MSLKQLKQQIQLNYHDIITHDSKIKIKTLRYPLDKYMVYNIVVSIFIDTKLFSESWVINFLSTIEPFTILKNIC